MHELYAALREKDRDDWVLVEIVILTDQMRRLPQ